MKHNNNGMGKKRKTLDVKQLQKIKNKLVLIEILVVLTK